jgi:hypothetical protein
VGRFLLFEEEDSPEGLREENWRLGDPTLWPDGISKGVDDDGLNGAEDDGDLNGVEDDDPPEYCGGGCVPRWAYAPLVADKENSAMVSQCANPRLLNCANFLLL